MNVWKRLWSIALCLCAAACVLCVSAGAAEDSSIPMPNWAENPKRSIYYGISAAYISGDVGSCKWDTYTYRWTWYQCDDTNKTNPKELESRTITDSSDLYRTPTNLTVGTYYYYASVTATSANGTNTSESPVNTITVKQTKPTMNASDGTVGVWPNVTQIDLAKNNRLSSSTFSVGSALNPHSKEKVEGTFAWKDGDTEITKTGRQDFYCIFTPNDMVNYTTLECRIPVSVTCSHNWDEGTVTTEATCTADGRRKLTCTSCGGRNYETISALGHDYTAWGYDGTQHWKQCSRCDATDADTKADHSGGAASCTEQAVCKTCNQPYGQLSAHTWTEATCTAPRTCSVCQTTEGNPLGHIWSAPTYAWNGADCTAERVCSRDESHKETETVRAAVTVTQEKTCVLDELSTYTASFTNPAFTAQTQEHVKTADRLGHDFTMQQYDEAQHWMKCSRCDAIDAGTKADHSGGAPTCTEQAVCTVCGQPYGNALGHDWADATCTEPKTCRRDGCGATEGGPLGHDWAAEFTEDTPAACETAGSKSKHCSRCDEVTEVTEIPALGHGWASDWTSDADNHWHKCSRCDAIDGKAAHEWNSGEITTPAACGTAGGKTYTCSVCAATKEETIDALGHDFTVREYDEAQHWMKCSRCGETDARENHSGGAASCTEKAVCAVCGQSYGNALGHDWAAEFTVDTAAACETAGSKSKHCSRCEAVTDVTEIPALGHDWGRYVVTTPATESNEGVETRTCTRDAAHTETRAILKLPARTYGVSGEVRKNDKTTPAADVTVTLVLGDRQIAKTATGPDGKYSFANIAPGIYNLVAEKDGVTMTVKVEVVRADVTVETVVMPEGKTNSVVEVRSDDPAENVEAVVGKLEEIFEDPSGKAYTDKDKTVVDGGGSVEIKLTVTQTDTDDTSSRIKEALPARASVGLRLELDVNKTVTPRDGDPGDPEPIRDTGILLETTIRLPDALQRKGSYTVYRLHGTEVHTLTAKPNGDGEYIEVSSDKTTITIHARRYSEYVIAYQESSGSGSGGSGGGSGAYVPSTPAGTPEQPKGDPVCPKDAACPLSRFSDLTPAAWYHDGVHSCIENGLMQGRSDGTFQPNGAVTRAQLTAVLWRLEGSPAVSGGETFRDVGADAWCAGAVRWAAKEGFVQGYRDGRFDPGAAVTRQQAAAILYRYALYKGMDVRVGEDTNILSFTDAFTVSEYAVPAMQWACGSGVMNGKAKDGGMILAPRDTTTRAQMAAMIARFCAANAK